MDSFGNVSLYIRRAESYCSKENIINVFASNNIGIVRDTKFIKKADSSGKEYNGVVVTFERWFMNPKVSKLLDDMASSADGTTKFIYDSYGHYWFINVHKTVNEEAIAVDVSLPDKQRIIALEELVRSMSSQMYFMKTRQEKYERQLMELEEKESHHGLCNMELRFKLEDKDMEIEWLKMDYEKALKESTDEATILKTRVACMAIDLARKETYIENTSVMTIEELTKKII